MQEADAFHYRVVVVQMSSQIVRKLFQFFWRTGINGKLRYLQHPDKNVLKRRMDLAMDILP